jgi:hypothetical protein
MSPDRQRPTADLLSDLRNQIAGITSHWMSPEQLAAAATPLAETAAEVDARMSALLSPLSVYDVRALAALEQAAQAGARVARLMGHGHVIEGIARHFTVDERGAFPGPNDDLRTCLLRVTASGGAVGEFFWPVAELMAEWADTTFVIRSD